jgi:hypothetical protein
VAAHDFRHLCSVRRTTGRSVDYLGRLTEILRPYRLPRPNVDWFPSTVQVNTPSIPYMVSSPCLSMRAPFRSMLPLSRGVLMAT